MNREEAHEEIVGKPMLTHPDFESMTKSELVAALRTEEAANYWLSFGIGKWCSKTLELDDELAEVKEALSELIAWAREAFDGLEYASDNEREELWERLAGSPDEPSVPQKAEQILYPQVEGP